MACFRVRGSAVAAEVAKAQPVPRPHFGLLSRARRASSAAPRERNGDVGSGSCVSYFRLRRSRRGRRRAWRRRCCLGLTRFDRRVSGMLYAAVEF
eukprot:2798212-Pleurochrysis_carterae.AAC.1